MSEYGAFGSDEEDAWSEDEAWSEGAESAEADLVELDEAERGTAGSPPSASAGGSASGHVGDGPGIELPGEQAQEHQGADPRDVVDGRDPIDALADGSDQEHPGDHLTVVPFEPTGEPRVDDAVARLDELAASPTADHVGVFEDLHRRLHEALSDLGVER